MDTKKITDIVKKNKSGRTETGKPANYVETEPKTVVEAKNTGRTVVVTYGRLNPPTTGHEKLVNVIKKAASAARGDAIVYLSQSTDSSKNPLKPEYKASLVASAFNVKTALAKDPVAMLKDLDKRYDNVIVVVGSDRIEKFGWMKKLNGKEGEWSFNSLEIQSAGERDPDADDVSGMSASKLRALAKANDINGFTSGLPAKIRNKAPELMRIINEHYMLEELEDEYENLAEGLTLSQRVHRAQIMRRLQSRLAVGQKRARAKRADEGHLMTRAKRAAKNFLRKRLLRDKDYGSLTYAGRAAIDARIKARGAAITKMAKRLLPRVRKAELARHLGGAWGSIRRGGNVQEQALTGTMKRSELPQIKDLQASLCDINTESVALNLHTASLQPTQNKVDDSKVNDLVSKYKEGIIANWKPIIVSSDHKIVDGHHRWAAAKMIGLDKMPCLRVLMPFEGIVQKLASSKAVEYRKLGESVDASNLREVVTSLVG